MMISFPFFCEPICLDDEHIPVICIENPTCFLQTVSALQNGQPEESNIVFSEKYTPFSFSKYGLFLTDYVNYSLPTHLMKKLYAHIEKICQTDMLDETFEVKKAIISFLEKVNKQMDYGFWFDDECQITDLLKMQNFVPDYKVTEPIESLLNFLIFLCELQPLRCCVLLNIHQYFTEEQLQPFFQEIILRHIPLVLLEGASFFNTSSYEKRWTLDRDLCEILAQDKDM